MLAEVIVTGAFTLTAALGGVALTQQHAAREAHRARAEARRGEQRRVISELIVAGREKIRIYAVVLPGFPQFNEKDHREFVETDTAKNMGRVNAEMTRALMQATLLVGDSPILESILRVRQLDSDFPDKAVGPALRKKPGTEGVLQGLGYLTELSAALNNLELSAGPYLRAPLMLPDGLWARTWRWTHRQTNRLLRRSRSSNAPH